MNMIEKIDDKVIVERHKLREACKKFEAIFIEYMLKTMRKSIPKTTLFKRENAEEIYTYLLDQMIAEKVAESKGLGISDILYKELSELIPKRTESKKRR